MSRGVAPERKGGEISGSVLAARKRDSGLKMDSLSFVSIDGNPTVTGFVPMEVRVTFEAEQQAMACDVVVCAD